MENTDIQVTEGLTIDKIIEKFIPVIGALFMTIGLGYLLYTSVWIDLDSTVKLGLGFFLSLVIIGSSYSFSEKLRYFADIGIGAGILLLYGTLIYGSRTTDLAVATIPETATLVTAFLFTIAIAYFASERKSQVILVLGMIGSYLTPFVIGTNDSWAQSISFNAYLTYFTAINIVVFFIGREINVRNILPLNNVGLLIGASMLYHLSYSNGVSKVVADSFLSGEIFSAILFFVITVFSLWNLLFSSKLFAEKDEGYITLGYVAPVLWFTFNIAKLTTLDDVTRGIFFILLSVACFVGWNILRGMHTRFQHTALYAAGIFSAVLAFFAFIPTLNLYSSLAIAYSSLIFGALFVMDSEKKIERLVSYVVLSLMGALLSLSHIFDTTRSFQSFLVVMALLPAIGTYFIARLSLNQNIIEIAKFYSATAGIIAVFFLFADIIRFIDIEFFVFFVVPLIALGYSRFSNKQSHEVESGVLRASMVWFGIGFIGVFFALVGSIYPAPADAFLFTHPELPTNWILIKGVFATIILFLGLSISRKLQSEQGGSRPSFLLVIFGYTTFLLTVNYSILAIINDMAIPMGQGGPRAIFATLWWIALALYMLVTGIRKGALYKSEKLLGLLLLALTVGKILLYDLATMDMQNKVIVLMVVGGALMLFSYGVQTKGWLKSDIKEEDKKAVSEKISSNHADPVEKKIDTLNDRVSSIDIGNTTKVIFDICTKEKITIESKNLIKIAKLVVNKMKKNIFEPKELQNIYEYVVNNYKSELSPEDYKKILQIMKDFVEFGGEVSFE